MIGDVHVYFGVALAGLVSFLSPCVLPLVVPYLSYIGGATLEQMSDGVLSRTERQRVIFASMFFVMGFSTVFIGLGAGASMLGQFMQTYRYEFSVVAGLVIIVFGLHFVGLLRIPLLYRDTRYKAQPAAAGHLGAYLIGLAFAFGWTPCIGPILATVLALAAQDGSLTAGVKLLLAYSLGLGVPFVLAATALGSFLKFMEKFRRRIGQVEKVMGAMLVLTGVLFLTGSMNWLGPWLLDTVPALGQIEEWATPESLKGEILKKGEGN